MDTALLLLLVGLSSSVNLGEASPGFVGQAIVQGRHLDAQTTFDTTDKYDATRQGGWRFQQTVSAVVGPGVLIGAEYGHRRGGWYTKDTLWLSGGWAHAWGQHVIHLVGRATVYSTADPHDAARQGALHVLYRRLAGRWRFQTEQGVLAYAQHGWHAGYYMTATAGVALF